MVNLKKISTIIILACLSTFLNAQTFDNPILLQNTFYNDGINTTTINVNAISISNSNQLLYFNDTITSTNDGIVEISANGKDLFYHPTNAFTHTEFVVNICDDGNSSPIAIDCITSVIRIISLPAIDNQSFIANNDYLIINSATTNFNLATNDIFNSAPLDSLSFVIVDLSNLVTVTSNLNTNGSFLFTLNNPVSNIEEILSYQITNNITGQISTAILTITIVDSLMSTLALNDDFLFINDNNNFALNVLQNDIFSGPATLQILDNPQNAIIDINSNNVIYYQSANSLISVDTFIYTVTTNYNGFQTDTAEVIVSFDNNFNCTDCVLPADCNNSGLVNNKDILDIGLNFNKIGPARDFASLDFYYQNAYNWFFNSNQTDAKFADANGDGIVNQQDLTALELNYGFFVDTNEYVNPPSLNAPSLTFENVADTVVSNQQLNIPIKIGSSNLAVQNLYGIAFTINFDPNVIKAVEVSFIADSSWLINGDSIIEIQKIVGNSLEIGMSKINQEGVSGNGDLGEFSIIIEENLIGEIDGIGNSNLTITDVKAIDNDGLQIELDPLEITLTYTNLVSSNGFDLLNKPQLFISSYPNPVSEQLTVLNKSAKNVKANFVNINGEILQEVYLESIGSININIANYQAGTYFLIADNGEILKILITK